MQKPGGLAALQQLDVPELTARYMAALDMAREGAEKETASSGVEVTAAGGFVKVSDVLIVKGIAIACN